MKIKKNIETTKKSTLKYINLESAKTQKEKCICYSIFAVKPTAILKVVQYIFSFEKQNFFKFLMIF